MFLELGCELEQPPTCTPLRSRCEAHQQPRAKRHAATHLQPCRVAAAPQLRLGHRPGDPRRGGARRHRPLRTRLRPAVHGDGRGAVLDRGAREELRGDLPRRHLQVPDFNTMYELYDPCTTMFFFRRRHHRSTSAPATTTRSTGRSTTSRRSSTSSRRCTAARGKGRGLVDAEGLLDQVQILVSACCVRPTTAARRRRRTG